MKNDSTDPVFSLWKTEDKDWLKKRRSEWAVLAVDAFSKASKRELAIFKKFYLKGVKDGYIEANTAFLLCPFTTSEEAKLVFYSSLFGPGEREKILVRFIFFVMPDVRSMPWGVDCVRSFCGGVLGKEYNVIHSTDMLGAKIASPSPGFFCDRYCYFAVNLMRGRESYHGCMECFDYFLSALTCGDTPNKPHLINIPSLLSSADDYLKTGDNAAVLDFARKIQSASVEIDANYQSWFS